MSYNGIASVVDESFCLRNIHERIKLGDKQNPTSESNSSSVRGNEGQWNDGIKHRHGWWYP